MTFPLPLLFHKIFERTAVVVTLMSDCAIYPTPKRAKSGPEERSHDIHSQGQGLNAQPLTQNVGSHITRLTSNQGQEEKGENSWKGEDRTEPSRLPLI